MSLVVAWSLCWCPQEIRLEKEMSNDIYVCGPQKNLNRTFCDRLTFSNIRGRTSRRFIDWFLALLSRNTSLSK